MEIICTLFEKHYDFGVAALCNSIYKSNFEGKIIVGYKGQLPFWINQLKKLGDLEYELGKNITVTLVCLDHIDFHLGYYKPTFLIHCFKTFKDAKRIYYFDPDICIVAKWHFFSEWVDCGVALCLDNCFPYVHRNHPWRKEWRTILNHHQLVGIPEQYVNSGFIGLNIKDIHLIYLWEEAINKYKQSGGTVKEFNKDSMSGLKGDQDLLNAALMFYDNEAYAIIGLEGMGFEYPCYIMGHAVGNTKPWRRHFTIDYLKVNIEPSFAEKLFFNHSTYPIKIFSKIGYKLKLIDLKFASVLNRFL